MFPIKVKKKERYLVFNKDLPVIIEGRETYDVVAPVSKLTGCRENPLQLLQSLTVDPARSRALNTVLAELPTIASDPRLSDDDKIDLMMSRLSTGTPAEDDAYRSMLEQVMAPLFEKADVKPADVVPPASEDEAIIDKV